MWVVGSTAIGRALGSTFISGPGAAILQITLVSVGGTFLCLIASAFGWGRFQKLMTILMYLVGLDIFTTVTIKLISKVLGALGV